MNPNWPKKLQRLLTGRFFQFAIGLCLLCLVALLILPLRTTLIRLAIFALGAAVWMGVVRMMWPKIWLRVSALVVTGFTLLVLLLPLSAEIDPDALRRCYVREIREYDGTRYVYGGETGRGIDCSGLVRAAMVDALTSHGLRSGSPAVIRTALTLWWRDSTAIDLGNGRSGMTIPLGGGGFQTLSGYRDVLPGDLAVTESGSHVLAYLGDDTWIEADPTLSRTHIVKLNGAFASIADQRVRFVRWSWLNQPESGR